MKRTMARVLMLAIGFCWWGSEAKAEVNNLYTTAIEGTRISVRPGRHVCTSERVISNPVQVVQTYKKPVYTPRARDCPNRNNCPQFDVTYVPANKTVFQLQKSSTFRHECCPGWTRSQRREKGCMQPICSGGCGEFGVCQRPGMCRCQTGYTGEMCDTDIDECRSRDHGCLHMCKNTAGSYMCACQNGFDLAADGKTCTFCFTCQKEYKAMVAAMMELQEQVSSCTKMKNDVERTQTSVAALKTDVRNLTEQNKHFKNIYTNLELKYDSAILEIEALRNLSQTTTSTSPSTTTSPITSTSPTSATTTTTTAATTTTTTPTTTTPTTTTTTPVETTASHESFQLGYDPYDLIVSLSNQIGQLEENLGRCPCAQGP